MNKFQIYNKALPACHTSDRCGTCQCTNNTQLATKCKQKYKMKQILYLRVTATSPINLTHQKEKSKIEYHELVQGDRTSIAVIRRCQWLYCKDCVKKLHFGSWEEKEEAAKENK